MKKNLIKALTVFAISGGICLGMNTTNAMASERIVATGTTTASYLNVRSSESTSSHIKGMLPRGSQVKIVKLDGKWDKIIYKSGEAYVYDRYVNNIQKVDNNEKVMDNARVTASALNLRSDNNTHCHIITCIPHNAKVDVLENKGDWSKVRYNGDTGYVANRYLSMSSSSSSSHSSSSSTSHQSSSQSTSKEYAYVTASLLNVRSGRSTSTHIKTQLARNTKVQVLDTKDGWSKIDYGRGQGYVSSQYLSRTSTTPASGPSEVKGEDWVGRLRVAKQTSQLVTVQATGTRAVVQFHQKDSHGKWHKVFDVKGFIGYGGLINPNYRHEGDGTTPTGVYDFGQAFGVASNPGTKVPYTQLTWHHWWVGDSHSKYFNTLQDRRKTGKYWSTAGGEPIIDKPDAYQYGIAINFNMNRNTAYRGWGIHFHCSDHLKHATAGCIGIPSNYMREFLQQVEPGAKIVISSPNGIYNY